MMKALSKTKKGFTLVEVLVAILLFVISAVTFFEVLTMCNYSSSYSRHKVQALYVAKRIIEEQRRKPFPLSSMVYGPVSIDTKGTFNNSGDDYMGQAFITVTNVDAYRQKLQVEVDWQEHTPLGNRNKKEFCTTDIANELQLN